jgi:ABC-2 type transport system permease protein
MHALRKIIQTEARLLAREPLALFFSLVFPTLLLVVLALVPALREPSEDMGGVRFIDFFAPSVIVLTLAMICLQVVPNALAAYREQGVLRRLAVTPVHPAYILIAQLAVNLAMAAVSTVLVIAVGRVAFDVPLPEFLLGFVVAFALGITALFAIGLLIAAVAPSTRAASGMATVVFVVVMFFGGVYVPRFLLPDAITRFGAYVPPGVQALQDGWIGTAPPQALHLLIMAGIALVATAAAARLFRWE